MIRTARTTSLLLAAALLLGALPALAADGKVNINTASVEQLQLLPRVGPAVAQRIVDHREKNGPFKAADDLLLVRGIGDKSLELLAPYVTTSGATTLAEKVRVPRPPKAEGSR
ncbi:MAG: ComEA family DNA-binding protein [Thermoanaerobaculia bacterium]|nr:ComEA family DNA-binding protein [Thermoanaerobaculia bacterium]MCZ7652469.1 helix-hairpin-helix domain-containing protein [Thermoanaerobaculia bacterium]